MTAFLWAVERVAKTVPPAIVDSSTHSRSGTGSTVAVRHSNDVPLAPGDCRTVAGGARLAGTSATATRTAEETLERSYLTCCGVLRTAAAVVVAPRVVHFDYWPRVDGAPMVEAVEDIVARMATEPQRLILRVPSFAGYLRPPGKHLPRPASDTSPAPGDGDDAEAAAVVVVAASDGALVPHRAELGVHTPQLSSDPFPCTAVDMHSDTAGAPFPWLRTGGDGAKGPQLSHLRYNNQEHLPQHQLSHLVAH